MRELRNTAQLKAWLRNGEVVELRERDTLLARIVPAANSGARQSRPDFAGRARETFGDTMLSTGSVARERDRY
jgi:antitoxin (DNA-binding transcriptional repressor) of toxin-antitoxin stability system